MAALLLLALSGATGYILAPRLASPVASFRGRAVAPVCALDFNDPTVAAEMAEVQDFDTNQIEEELALSGIPPPPTMNDFELRSMLVELRMRKKGKMGTATAAPKKPASYGNDYERALFEKPAFKALIEEYRKTNNVNAMNLATEHLMNPRQAKERYGGTSNYQATLDEIEAAMNARVEQTVSTPKLYFAGFPSNMGEDAIKMTLGTFGTIVDFSCEASDDGMTMTGRAEFEEVSQAKAAIDKYDGVDMGLGTTLELQAL